MEEGLTCSRVQYRSLDLKLLMQSKQRLAFSLLVIGRALEEAALWFGDNSGDVIDRGSERGLLWLAAFYSAHLLGQLFATGTRTGQLSGDVVDCWPERALLF